MKVPKIYKKNSTFTRFLAFSFLLGLVVSVSVFSIIPIFASALANPYNPGVTLDPDCLPGDLNCTVSSLWTISGTNVLLDQAGNVGIGSSSPSYKFTTVGDSYFQGNLTTTGTLSASNFTGTNTGDITLSSATGLSLAGQALSITSGYVIPTSASTTNWNNIYNSVSASSTYWDTAYSWGNHAGAGYLTSYSESDPLFTAASSSLLSTTSASLTYQPLGSYLSSESDPLFMSASSTYLSTTSASSTYLTIATASSTYYLASNPDGYISSFAELDPVYTASSWSTTTNNSANWNTAYGWGNHANAGYLTSALASSTYLSIATASSTYQPIGSYLTAITGTQLDNVFSSNGFLIRTGANTYSIDTNTYFTNPMDAVGQLIYGGASGAATKLSAGSAGQMLQSNGAAAPTWTTATYPSTTSANQILFSTADNVIGSVPGLTYDTADSGTLTVGTGDELFRILGNGNVGIGSSSPLFKLTVTGNAYISDVLTVASTTGTSTFAGRISALNLTGTNTGDLTLVSASSTGLSLASQALSITSGYNIPLSASTTNWNNTFNTFTSSSSNWTTAYDTITASSTYWDSAYNLRLTTATSPLSFSANTLSISLASSSANGYLSSTDWTTFNDKLSTTTASSTYAKIASPTFTGTSTFSGDIYAYGDIIPNGDKIYSLGSLSNEWKHLYVGNGSVYINGQRVLGADSSDDINVTADINQNLIFKTYGTGDLELNPLGDATSSGQIQLKGDVLLSSNKKFIGGANLDNVLISGNVIQAANLNGGLSIAATGTGDVYITHGNFGVGNTAPSHTLDVTGDIFATNFTGTSTGVNTGDVSLINNINGLTISGQALTLGLAGASATGTLSATDWNTFNDKLSTTTASSTYAALSGATFTGPISALSINGLELSANNTDFNTTIGTDAGLNLVTGAQYNTFVGFEAGKMSLASTNSADSNTALGHRALWSLTTGSGNTASGDSALRDNTTGSNNAAFGNYSLPINTTGYNNTAIGNISLASNTTGSNNTAIGLFSLYANTTGEYNTSNGIFSLYLNTSGFGNTSNGSQSLYSNTTGNSNTAYGYGSLFSNATGSNNVALGNYAGRYEMGSNSFYVDALDRTNTAGDKAGALLYGTFNATPASQTLNINASTTIAQNLLVLGTGNSLFAGKLGIGTNNPLAALDLKNGDPNVGGNRAEIAFQYVSGGFRHFITSRHNSQPDNGNSIEFFVNTSGTAGGSSAPGTGNINVMGMYGTGRVGIGTTSPISKLSIMGTSSAPTVPLMDLASSTGASLFRVTSGGNVGIGTTSPFAELSVVGDTFISDVLTVASTTGTSTFAGAISASKINGLPLSANDTDFNILIGKDAGLNLATGAQYNTFLGYQAGLSSSTGSTNVADKNTGIGYQALYSNTTGTTNTANGYSSLYSNTSGSGNNGNGYMTLYSNTIGNNNTANGSSALALNTTGDWNTANGAVSLYSNTTGSNNTANGVFSLYSNTTGQKNTASGVNSLYSNTTGENNTANGLNSLYSNTTGSYNSASGMDSLRSNTTGNNNTANGYTALYSNTTGVDNTANGFNALFYNTTGNTNTANGSGALLLNTTGSLNTANGAGALRANTTGGSNTAIGVQALLSNTTGSNNTANGVSALSTNTTGYQNTANGTLSLYSNTTGHDNSANGFYSLVFNTTGYNNVANGVNSLRTNTTGINNTANGFQSLYSNIDGYSNVANGAYSLFSNTSGPQNTANGMYSLYGNTTGFNNTASGYYSLYANTTGYWNTGTGNYTLQNNIDGAYNTANGVGSMNSNTSGWNNTALGVNSLWTNATGTQNVALGFSAGKYETESHAFYVDNQDRTNTAGDKAGALLYGTFNATPANQTLKTNATFTANKYISTTGTAALPDYSFSGDPDSGMYLNAAGTVGFSIAGNERFRFDSSNFGGSTAAGYIAKGALLSRAVIEATPTYTFGGDTNTGIYSPLDDTIGLVTGGVERFRASTTALSSTLPLTIQTATTKQAIFSTTANNYNVLDFTRNSTQLVSVGHESTTGGGFLTSSLANSGIIYGANGLHLAANASAVTGNMTIATSGNVGIGTTSPNAKLAIIATTSNYWLRLNDDIGNEKAYFYNYAGSAGFNMRDASQVNSIRMMTSGDSYLNGGNVGIGTTAPGEPLHIKTNETGAGTSLFRLDNGGTAGNEVGMEFYTSATDSTASNRTGRIYGAWDGSSYINARLGFQTMTTGNVLVDTMTLKTGNVGIGTTSPLAKLDIYGIAGTADIFALSSSSNARLFTVTSEGNVGIGTTTPQYQFVVSGPTGGIGLDRTGGNDPFIFLSRDGVSSGQIRGDTTGLSLSNSDGSIDHLRVISSSGNVGIGTTVPTSKLTVAGSDLTAQLNLHRSNDANGRGSILFTGESAGSDTYIAKIEGYGSTGLTFYTDSDYNTTDELAARMTIQPSGNVGIGTTTPLSKFSIVGNAGTDSILNLASSTGASMLRFTSAGNLGIGTTNPSSKLHIVTATGANFQNAIYLEKSGGFGVGALQNYYVDVSNYGLGFAVVNNTKMVINNNGLVGIGTLTPLAKLSIMGTSSAPTTPLFDLASSTGTSLFRVTSEGNVGIGTTSPGAKLEVVTGSTDSITTFKIDTAGVMSLSRNHANNPQIYTSMNSGQPILYMATGGTDKVVLHTAGVSYFNGGNVGIGTTTPLSKLSIVGGAGGSETGLGFYEAGGSGVIQTGASIFLDIDDDNNSTDAKFSIRKNGAGTELFRVQEDGNIGIGTTSPLARLHVETDASDSSYLVSEFINPSTGANADGYIIVGQGTRGSTFGANYNGNYGMWGMIAQMPTIYISNGSVGIGTTSFSHPLNMNSGAHVTTGGTWTNASSRDLKENFIELDKIDVLNKIAQLDITQWNYKTEDTSITHIGPIAEDFYDKFSVGGTNKSISSIDPAGVALIGIQVLNKNMNLIFGTSSIETFANSTSTMESYDVTDFFANMVKLALNKLSSVFIREVNSDKITSKEVNTDKVCVGSTCITEEELKALLENNNVASVSTPTIETPTSTTTEETATSTEETAITTEPIIEPEATSTEPTTTTPETPITEPTPEPVVETPPTEPIVETSPIVEEPIVEPAPEPTPEPVVSEPVVEEPVIEPTPEPVPEPEPAPAETPLVI
ncbi:MAG: tail fiber domain-containing protein [Minisyncoccia bacterium]